ncbi:HU family DNA-binding protein [Maritimibacter sp. UBA3975]|uniref:HU family DNA-binding protein n=1 Tax=Maritimibacter sp. UBA3975 TaxID=1946833 RepID=UPI0025B9B251|nr:HU family DNA-binding protein [Maritimibacter sp. UBA3975]
MVTSTKKSSTKSKATATSSRAKSAPTKTAAASGEIDAAVAAEAEGLVAPEDKPAAAPVQGVTRPVPATGSNDDDGPDGKMVKKDLIDRVVARSGVKPRYVRQVTEALLIELGSMLEEAEILQLQPLGTVKVQRRKDVDDGEVIITKVKRKKPEGDGNDPLATAAE